MKRFDLITRDKLNTKGLFLAGRPTDEIVIHCSANSGRFSVRDCYHFHTAPKPAGRGWSDIGYHFYIERDGSIFVGRPLKVIGAHVAGNNTGTIGVCYEGGLSSTAPHPPADTRTAAQRQSLIWLLEALTRDNWDIVRISGHNEHSPKACPSFKVKGDESGNITNFREGIKQPKPLPKPEPPVRPETPEEVLEDPSVDEHRPSLGSRIWRFIFGSHNRSDKRLGNGDDVGRHIHGDRSS